MKRRVSKLFPEVPVAEKQRIIFEEMVRQVGDLGNYVIKAVVTLLGAGLFSLLVISETFTEERLRKIFDVTPLFLVFILLYFAIPLAIWWATRCHVKLALVVNLEVAGPKSQRRNSFPEWVLFGDKSAKSSAPVIVAFFIFLFVYLAMAIVAVLAVIV